MKNIEAALFCFVISISMIGCGYKTAKPSDGEPIASQGRVLKGDSCVYGFACDGCTDSVLVLLPENISDPVKYEIIDARRMGQVFGHPKIGDRIAMVIDPEDSLTAQLVIDLDQLQGTWCYTVMPQMRTFDNMSKRLQRRMERNMPDSVRNKLFVPREYGFTLSSHYSARPVGMKMGGSGIEEDSPVIYPTLPMYSEWHIFNGKLLLTQQRPPSEGKASQKPLVRTDTATITMLAPDTLVLEFSDGTTKGYYRKNTSHNSSATTK